jgi:hypothetical protein
MHILFLNSGLYPLITASVSCHLRLWRCRRPCSAGKSMASSTYINLNELLASCSILYLGCGG